MKKLITIILCLLQTTLFAQQKFTIHGKITRLTKSKNVHLSNFNIPIQNDGTFEYTGEIAKADMMYLRSDSSYLMPIWIEAGDYVVKCAETDATRPKWHTFSLEITQGPEAAMVFGKFEQTVTTGTLNDGVKNDPKSTRKSQMLAYQKYMDNMFKQHPQLACLPNMINEVHYYVGNEATKKFIAQLSPEMKKTDIIVQLENDLHREDKLAEGVFEDFTLQTADGKPFKLSSLKNKKLILIDFWASGCGPCRAVHPEYVDLYKKYAGKGLEIVSISIDNNNDAWQNAIQKDNIGAWVNVSELKAWNAELIKHYYINYIPFHLLLDGNRKILRTSMTGDISEKDIIAALK